VLHKERHILAAFAQGGKCDGVDVQALEEVAAELLFGNQVLEVTVGGGDQAHIGLDGLVTAYALELSVL